MTITRCIIVPQHPLITRGRTPINNTIWRLQSFIHHDSPRRGQITLKNYVDKQTKIIVVQDFGDYNIAIEG